MNKNTNTKNIKNENKEESLIKRMAYGVLMGLSDGTPGFSGGTTLSLLNFYDKLIFNFKGIFKPEEGKTRTKHLLFVLPFMIVWVGTLLAFMVAINLASKKGYGIVAVFAFATFALLSIPLFILVNKPQLTKTINSEQVKSSKTLNLPMIWLAILGFILMVAIGLIVRFALPNGGVSMLSSQNNSTTMKLTTKSALLLIAAGFCAGFAMLIPGISGSLILYLFNVYTDISHTISNAIHGDIKESLPIFAILGVAIIFGIVTSIFTTSFILKKWKEGFVSFSLGLVSASFITILIALSKTDYKTLNNELIIGLSILAIFVAIGANLGLAFYLKKQGVIKCNFKK